MLQLKADIREITGKQVKALREKGLLPAVIYGPKKKSVPLTVPLADFKKIWKEAGEATLVDLEIADKKHTVLIHDVALDPLKNEPIHVDFYAVQMDKPIEATVPLVFEGVAPAVKNFDGVLVKVMHEVEVEALPKDLPSELKVDITPLATFDDKILVRDIGLPSGVKILADPEEVVALVEEPRKEEEIEAAEEEKPKLEEIEVVGKEKKEDEEGKAPEDKTEKEK